MSGCRCISPRLTVKVKKTLGKKACLLSSKHLDLTGLARNYSTHEKLQVKSNATKKLIFVEIFKVSHKLGEPKFLKTFTLCILYGFWEFLLEILITWQVEENSYEVSKLWLLSKCSKIWKNLKFCFSVIMVHYSVMRRFRHFWSFFQILRPQMGPFSSKKLQKTTKLLHF